MKFVPWNKESGEIQWRKVVEFESAEVFSQTMNARLKELGIDQLWYSAISATKVQERGPHNKMVADWHACETDPQRLI